MITWAGEVKEANLTGHLTRLNRINAPHSGQSSQLPFESHKRNAQFLSTAIDAVLVRSTASRALW